MPGLYSNRFIAVAVFQAHTLYQTDLPVASVALQGGGGWGEHGWDSG